MELWQAIVLGLVQGLTEFLPVSSSGHLVLTQEIIGVSEKGNTFEVLAHFGTLISVVVYFWKPLWRMFLSILPPFKPEYADDRKRIVYLAIESVPAAIVGFSPLKGRFEDVYDKPAIVALLLMVTGLLLFIPRLLARRGVNEVGPLSALAMGIGQAFAILPGISRSGSTIVAGMLAGTKSSAAAEFSFLMAIPAIAAAAVLEVGEMENVSRTLLINYSVGAIVAFASGLIAIYTVLAAIRRGKFEVFGIYCLIAGAIAWWCFR